MVRPVPSDSVATNRVSSSSTVDLPSIPSISVQPLAIDTMATAGIVRPIVASAEPSARFRLVCSWLALAARSAASPSGISTMAAMMMPTSALGAPMLATAASTDGAVALASNTTAPRQASSNSALMPVTLLVGRGASDSPLSVASVGVK